MADVTADNAIYMGDFLWWRDIGNDTPVVFVYTCPVDDHVLVSAVKLQTNSDDDPTGGTKVCPLHDTTLDSGASVDVSP